MWWHLSSLLQLFTSIVRTIHGLLVSQIHRDRRLSWPWWLTDSRRLNHEVVTCPASSLTQYMEGYWSSELRPAFCALCCAANWLPSSAGLKFCMLYFFSRGILCFWCYDSVGWFRECTFKIFYTSWIDCTWHQVNIKAVYKQALVKNLTTVASQVFLWRSVWTQINLWWLWNICQLNKQSLREIEMERGTERDWEY